MIPRTSRSIRHSRLVAAAASLAMVFTGSVVTAAVSQASDTASSLHFREYVPPTAFATANLPDGTAQLNGVGVDSRLGLAVVTGGHGELWTINTTSPEHVMYLDNPFATAFVKSQGIVDEAQHVVYLGQILDDACNIPTNAGCLTGLAPDAAAGAPGPAAPMPPQIEAVRLTGATGSHSVQYTLPTSTAGGSVVAMRPFALGGRHLLYVLVNRTYDSATAAAASGFVHTSTLFELDADKLLKGAPDAMVWQHDVSTCATFTGAPRDFLGIDPAGRFAYFDCRNIVIANSGSFTPGGAVVVDFPQPLPTAEQEKDFVTSFYPAGAPTAKQSSSGDPAHNLLIQASIDPGHNKLYVFDALHRAWTGSVPVEAVGANLWGIAVDPTNGEAYTVGDNDTIAASQATALPVRQGDNPSLGNRRLQGGDGPPLFDPATGQLFLFGSSWMTGALGTPGTSIPDVAVGVFQDMKRIPPFDATPADADQFTHDVPITPETPVTYQAIASGYGLRAVQVGGLSGTQAAQSPVSVSNPAYSIDGDCTYVGAPCNGVVPSMPDASRSVTFARTNVSTESSGVTGDATPYQLDHTSESEFTSLSSPGTLSGATKTTGLDLSALPGAPAPPDQVSQQVAPATCTDLSDKKQDTTEPAARVQCDNTGRHAAAVAVAPGPPAGSPVQVGYATSRIDKASQSDDGAVVDVTSEADGIVVGVPGGPTMRIGSVVTHATSKAVGLPGSATATFSREISEVTISDPSGAEVFACGFRSTPSCDPRQLTDQFNRQSPFPVEFLTPEPDSYYGRSTSDGDVETVAGSPGGAKAEVIKTVHDYFNDMNVNGDASWEVPGLQIVMVNDQQQPSRLVFDLAAVHAESHQTVGLAPPPLPELAPPSLELSVVDGSTPPVPLSGATFSLQGPEGSDALSCLTGADGIGTCTFPTLAPGSYTIQETAAPPGFAPVKDYELTLEPGNEYKTKFVNLPAIGSVHLTLSAPGDDGAPLPGGVFAMLKAGSLLDPPLATCTTDAKGSCDFEKVPLGDYTMQQVTAPAGYLVSDSVAFSLDEPAQVATLEFVDGVPGKAAVPPKVIPGKPAVPPKVIPGKPAVPPRTMVLPGDGTGDAALQPALEPAGYETSVPPPVVSSQASGSTPSLRLGGLAGAPARLARLIVHSPQQAVLLLFVWLVLGMPVYLWVRRRQFLTATEGV